MAKNHQDNDWLVIKERLAAQRKPLMVSVPKRVIRLSTQRSRIKRLIREAVRLGRLKAPQGKMLHFIIKKNTPKDIRLAYVQEKIKTILKKSKNQK